MYKIVRKRVLNPTVTQIEVDAPLVARKAKPGQFIILRVDEEGERIPLTVAGTNPEELILEDQFMACSDQLIVMTDDGSYGRHGNVTVPLKEMLEAGEKFDMIITIGPLIMMKFVVAAARPFGVPVTASMNPIMIDGTCMCGGCRITLTQDGKRVTKFACVDGPDFNGYEIDFDEAMSRGRMYQEYERHAYEEACNLFKGA